MKNVGKLVRIKQLGPLTFQVDSTVGNFSSCDYAVLDQHSPPMLYLGMESKDSLIKRYKNCYHKFLNEDKIFYLLATEHTWNLENCFEIF